MKRTQWMLLAVCSVLSFFSVLLCVLRMVYWEQGVVISVEAIGGSGLGSLLDSGLGGTVGLYLGTILLLIGTSVFAVRVWNHAQ